MASRGHRPHLIQAGGAGLGAQDLALVFGLRISHAGAQQKTVKLRFRQRVRSVVLDRVLGGDHQKGLGQGMTAAIDRDLAFVHGFQQR